LFWLAGILALGTISVSASWAVEGTGTKRLFKAPYDAVWKAASVAWDSLCFPTLRRSSEEGLLESDTIMIPGDTAKAWMADAEPESWWQQGRYALTLRVARAGKLRTRVTVAMWIEARGVPHPAMVSLRIRVGKSNGKLESRVLDEIGRQFEILFPKTKLVK
jgi:hypothetical protein